MLVDGDTLHEAAEASPKHSNLCDCLSPNVLIVGVSSEAIERRGQRFSLSATFTASRDGQGSFLKRVSKDFF
jgi:hypothetical protein